MALNIKKEDDSSLLIGKSLKPTKGFQVPAKPGSIAASLLSSNKKPGASSTAASPAKKTIGFALNSKSSASTSATSSSSTTACSPGY